MDVGTTVEVEITDRSNGYLKAEYDDERFSVAGDGSIGETRAVRVIKEQDGIFIAVTNGATLRLRIDEVVDDSTVRADPAYGPVFIPTSLSPGDWWRCVVTEIEDDHLIAEIRNRSPANSSIPRGDQPEDHTQSLNHLLSGGKL